MRTVAAIYTAPVKSLALEQPSSVILGYAGIAEDRRFLLIDDQGRLLTQRQIGRLVLVKAHYDIETEILSLLFPDGFELHGRVDSAEPVAVQVWGRAVAGKIAAGDWNRALSEFCQAGVRLVKTDGIGQSYDEYPVSVLSQASIDFLSQKAPDDTRFEGKRFRPNFLIDGCSPHEEDFWLGGTIKIGPELRLRLVAPDPRCAITTLDPETGERDFDTPRLMLSYRPSARAPYFGIFGMVEVPGSVSVGDHVEIVNEPAQR